MLEKQAYINDKYKIIDYLYEGGTSHLYNVQTPQGELAILKVVKKPSTLFNSQIDNEAKVLASINHERIPKLFDKLIVNKYYKAIIIEKIAALNLSDIMEKDKGKFCWQEVLDIAIQLAEIIQVFHQSTPSIVIRDIKPSNILLSEQDQVYLIDFGVSTTMNDLGQAKALGTIGYAAPEQFENGVVDQRSDLFSLGATLFYIVSGGNNIYTSNPADILQDRLPKKFSQIILKLTEIATEKRYNSVSEVIHAFKKVKPTFVERAKELLQSDH